LRSRGTRAGSRRARRNPARDPLDVLRTVSVADARVDVERRDPGDDRPPVRDLDGPESFDRRGRVEGEILDDHGT
jgi:hypothetical protein